MTKIKPPNQSIPSQPVDNSQELDKSGKATSSAQSQGSGFAEALSETKSVNLSGATEHQRILEDLAAGKISKAQAIDVLVASALTKTPGLDAAARKGLEEHLRQTLTSDPAFATLLEG